MRPGASESDMAEMCAGDRLYGKRVAACEERHGHYRAICELPHGGDGRDAATVDGKRVASWDLAGARKMAFPGRVPLHVSADCRRAPPPLGRVAHFGRSGTTARIIGRSS